MDPISTYESSTCSINHASINQIMDLIHCNDCLESKTENYIFDCCICYKFYCFQCCDCYMYHEKDFIKVSDKTKSEDSIDFGYNNCKNFKIFNESKCICQKCFYKISYAMSLSK